MPWIEWFSTEEGHHLPPRAAKWIVMLGRAGFAARGLIYCTVGALAGMAAAGMTSGDTTDAQGAVSFLNEMPLGQPLVIAAGAGLAGYALWRILQAVFNLDRFRGPRNGLWMRLGFILDGVFHGLFAYTVFSVSFSGERGDAEDDAKTWTAAALEAPFGPWLVAVGGLVAFACGAYLIYKAYSHRYAEQLQERVEREWTSKFAIRSARFGESARAVVFAVVGIFLVRSALHQDPEETKGLGGAMQALAEQPLGRIWLALVAIGFLAYGAYSIYEARYRKIGKGQAE
jgi:hypothetical protein